MVEADCGCDLLLIDLLGDFLAVLFILEALHLYGLVKELLPVVVFDVLHAFISNNASCIAVVDVS